MTTTKTDDINPTDDNSPDLGLILGASLVGAAFVIIVGIGVLFL